MKVAVTGGKGGTGKSTVATALAVELARRNSVLLADLDVDCPNDHLILGIERTIVGEVEQFVPRLDAGKCAHCGRCAEVCREGAVVQAGDRPPVFVLDQCTGCRACQIACPTGAISEGKRTRGYVYRGKGEVELVSGEIVPGVEEGSPVVTAVKGLEGKQDFVVRDTAAGTHCTVIAALLGADLALAVTEPTPLGAHDLELILQLTDKLKVPCKVVLNKAGVGKDSLIDDVLAGRGGEVVARLPYSKDIVRSYSRGEPVKHPVIGRLAAELEAGTWS